MTITDLIAPFADYAFMRRALAACAILSLGAAPLGVFMHLRRMSLVGDAMSHAILPGVAIAFAAFGLSLVPMTLSALATGVLVALLATALTRYTKLAEDAGFTLVYLLSLAFGVVMVSRSGSGIDLLHILFGNILGIDNAALYLASAAACLSVVTLCLSYRAMVIDCYDPDYLRVSGKGRYMSALFFVLLIVNLVASFQVLGTLLSLGLLLLPAMTARFWTTGIDRAMGMGVVLALASSFAGLLASYYADLPAGPSIVLVLGGACVFSALFGPHGSVAAGLRR